jgi:hypothetical protein
MQRGNTCCVWRKWRKVCIAALRRLPGCCTLLAGVAAAWRAVRWTGGENILVFTVYNFNFNFNISYFLKRFPRAWGTVPGTWYRILPGTSIILVFSLSLFSNLAKSHTRHTGMI